MKKRLLLIIVVFLLTGMKMMAIDFTQDGIAYTVYSTNVTVTGYTGTATEIVIPNQVTNNGTTYKVNVIGENAFKEKSLKSVVLPAALTQIGAYAFYGNALREVVIPPLVNKVGTKAFASNVNLNKVTWLVEDYNSSLTISSSNDYFDQCNNLHTFYLIGIRWHGYTNLACWPKSSRSGSGTVTYYVNPSYTSGSPHSNVTSNGIVKNYSITFPDMYAGTAASYGSQIGENVTWWLPQDNTPYQRTSLINMTVDDTGILRADNTTKSVTALKAGATNVDVKYRGVTIAEDVYAKVLVNDFTSISVSPTTQFLNVGETFTITPTPVAEHGAVVYAEYTWTTSNASVATVSDGVVTAKGSGTATITCKHINTNIASASATCTVTVYDPDISNLKINGGVGALLVNLDTEGVVDLTPTFDCAGEKSNVKLNWTSDATGIASFLSSTSKGEAVKSVILNGNVGTANIDCRHTNKDGSVIGATIKISTYRPDISNLKFSQDTYKVVNGSTLAAPVSFTSEDEAKDVKITYTMGDESIVTFADGVLTGKKNGTTTITASHVQNDGTTVTTTATVIVADFFVDSFSISPSSQALPLGETLTVVPQVTGASGSVSYTWSSSNEKVATVDNDGKVTSKAYGSALITCRLDQTGEEATCKVSVYNPDLIYVGNIFYKLATEAGSGTVTAEVTNCAGGAPSDLTAEGYEYNGTVNIPATVIHDGTTYEVTVIGKYAFYNQVDLQALTIPTSVKVFDVSSCEGAKNLARVNFKSKAAGLLRINNRAFYNCKKLNDVDLPNTTTSIYKYAFQHCDALSDITLSTSLNIIDEYAFADCKVLNNVTLPESLRNIQNAAFRGDVALTAITLPARLQGLGAAAFENCSALKEVTFLTASDQDFTVGADAFAGTSVTKVNIAHLDSWIMTNFSNPAANPASISHHIYQGGTEIINAVVPEGPIAMNDNVFYGCSSLKTLQLPSTLKQVNDNTLYGCTSLEKVYALATKPAAFIGVLSADDMNDVFAKADLIVADASVSAYKADTWWGRFKSVSSGVTGNQCAKPTIAYKDNKLVFTCATSGVNFVYSVKVADAKDGSGNNVPMTTVYNVSVYATKTGMANSETVTQDITVGGSGSGVKGDVDGDGVVDVNDVQTTINIILGK